MFKFLFYVFYLFQSVVNCSQISTFALSGTTSYPYSIYGQQVTSQSKRRKTLFLEEAGKNKHSFFLSCLFLDKSKYNT